VTAYGAIQRRRHLNTYEALFLLRPDLEKEEEDRLLDSIQKEIAKQDGQLRGAQNLSKKPLAYPIKGHKEGLYYLVNFEAPADAIKSLRNAFKLNNSILRNLILKKGG